MQVSKFTWSGDAITRKTREAAAEGLFEIAEDLLKESGAIVPLHEGELQNSGETSIDRDKLEATVSYDMPYAVRQHEDRKLKHPNGRKAKYLETPLRKLQADYSDRIAKKITGVY